MSESVLITGGVGFIGQYVAQALILGGHSARALDVVSEQVHRHPDQAVSQFPGDVIVGDVRDFAAVTEAADGCSGIIHLAAETGTGQSMYEQDRYSSVNVDGTRTVLDVAKSKGIRVIVASSRAVYGEGPFECTDHGRQHATRCCQLATVAASIETDPFGPLSVYGETKVQAERLARQAGLHGTQVISIRPQNVIGAGQAPHNPYTGVLAAFAARLRQGEVPLVYGSGSQTRDFVDVSDVARMIAWLYERPDDGNGLL